MEPVKFEEHIKEQLQKREIKPSEGSWEKLQGRLNHREEPSRSKIWWVTLVAAVAVVFFMLGTLFNSPVENIPEVVDSQKPTILKENTSEETQKELTKSLTETSALVKNNEKDELPKKMKSNIQESFIKPSEKIASVTELQDVKIEVPVVSADEEASFMDASSQYSIDSEVEALLLVASSEIENDPAYEVQTVSAGELLNEVEHELELNFRQKVFEVLKDGYSKAKTAVANRN